MHKLASKPITLNCFEIDDYNSDLIIRTQEEDKSTAHTLAIVINHFVPFLEGLRQKYNETGNKLYWKELIRWLPESWLQTRTITMNYENLLSMVHQREHHKLTEWSDSFINWAKALPYASELIFNQDPFEYFVGKILTK